MPSEFDFGSRRVMRMGYSRYVTLPKDWLRNIGMENFGELAVSMNSDGNLVLSPAPGAHGDVF